MGERGAAVTRHSAAAAVVEVAGAMTLFRLLPSYANSWFLLAVFFSASAPPAFGGVWTLRAEGALTVGLPPRLSVRDSELWALDLVSGLSDATSTSKMSPKMPLTNACRSPVAGSPSTTVPG